jgi:hypothetical protein
MISIDLHILISVELLPLMNPGLPVLRPNQMMIVLEGKTWWVLLSWRLLVWSPVDGRFLNLTREKAAVDLA